MKSLALFDFDGTLITKDSFLLFIRYYHGSVKYYFGILANLLNFVKYFSGMISAHLLKEKMIIYFFAGENSRNFGQKALKFSTTEIPKIENPEAIQKLVEHIKNGHEVTIVSASPEIWIKPWAKNHGTEVIATKLEVLEDKITGKIDGINCKGREKVHRIKEKYDLASFNEIYAYGDSSGDKEMLELANHQFYRNF